MTASVGRWGASGSGGGPLIDVLLATYNGAQFVEAQLESLAAQTYTNFRILVSDDGSSDTTVALVEAFAQRMADLPVRWVNNPHSGRGPARNFEVLMSASLADGLARWVSFCDQDDVWLPLKLERLVRAMTLVEDDGEELPCLVHCDLRVVDDQLRTLATSFIQQQQIDVKYTTLPVLLGVNHVTGCAMMINRALLAMALPLPDQAVMHDWWCALLSSQGRRHFVAEQLVLYRQHGANQVGAKSRVLTARVRRGLREGNAVLRRVRWLGRATLAQAQALQERFRRFGTEDTEVADYVRWRSLPFLRRLPDYRRYYKGPELDNICRLIFW